MTANYITLSRIIIGPLFAWSFTHSFNADNPALWLLVSLALLILIEVSDALDGHIARKRNEVSDFGKFFDPVADSVSRLTVFCSFLCAGIIPLWMFLIFLYRDLFVSAIRYICVVERVVVPARISGKLKAVFQAIGSFGVVLFCLGSAAGIGFVPQSIAGMNSGFLIMLFPALFTAYSAFDYWYGNRDVIAKSSLHKS